MPPESAPLPNPWTKKERQQAAAAAEAAAATESLIQFQYVGVDGERETAGVTGPGQICLLACCPCLAPSSEGRCGPKHRKQFRHCAASFLCIVSLVQVAMMVVALVVGNGFAIFPTCNPMLGPVACTFVTLGGANRFLLVHRYEVYRLFMPALLHGGLIHLAANLFSQLRFGLYLERRWGHWRLFAMYWVSSVGGMLLSLCTQDGVAVGASAALLGLLGGHTIEIICKWKKTNKLERKCSLFQMIFWILLILFISLSPVVDAGGHIGGLITGSLIGFWYFTCETDWPDAVKTWIPRLALALVFIFFTILSVLLAITPVTNAALCQICPTHHSCASNPPSPPPNICQQ